MRNALTAAACLACVAVFCIRGELAVRATSPIFDEAVHLTAGYSYWRTGDFRINRETPPLMKLLWAIPLRIGERPAFTPDAEHWEKNDIWRMGDAFVYESPVPTDEMVLPARRVNVAARGDAGRTGWLVGIAALGPGRGRGRLGVGGA